MKPATSERELRFSLVLCTRGRRDELIGFFESLARQGRTDFEVLLVDQNPDDRLADVVAAYGEACSIRHIRMAETGISRGRNRGLAEATGELIGFPDDDCQYLPSYLDTVHRIFDEDPSIGGLTGHPTAVANSLLPSDCRDGRTDLDTRTVLNRSQEFTVFVRRQSLGAFRYNERLGIGADTPWGADEGPELLIRIMQSGCRLVYFPKLLVFHPNKTATITRATLTRALTYARGRGCLLRLHRFPLSMILTAALRPAAGTLLYFGRLELARSAYYAATVFGLLRGLLMTRSELALVEASGSSLAESHDPAE